jgi:hypothetical protein
MEQREFFRLMMKLRGLIATRKIDVGRTREQIADVEDHGVTSVWEALTNKPIDVIELPAIGEKGNDAVVACTTLTMGERPTMPDNKITPCAYGCGRMIQWRPYLPEHITKVCLYCVTDRLEHGDQ